VKPGPLRLAERFDRVVATRAALWLAVALIALALLAPRLTLPRRVFDGVIVLDITQSMNTPDMLLDGRPAGRLEFAKARLHQALAQLPCGSRVGWGVFTEYRSYILIRPVEVCANYSDLQATLDRIGGGMAWAPGSQITRGLFSALRISAHMPEQPAIVFITDGHEAPPLRRDWAPVLPDEVVAPRGMIVGVGGGDLRPIPKADPTGHVIGIWGPEDVMQSPPRESIDVNAAESDFAPTGTEHLSSLKESHLQQLARLTRLGYVRLAAATPMASILLDSRATRWAPAPVPLRLPLTLLALAALAAGIGVRRDLRHTLAAVARAVARRPAFTLLRRRRPVQVRPGPLSPGRT
jgi:mxaL protein